MILEVARGHIDLEVAGRRVRVTGEGFHQGDVDFVAIESSILKWSDGTEVTNVERQEILQDLLASSDERGLIIEIE